MHSEEGEEVRPFYTVELPVRGMTKREDLPFLNNHLKLNLSHFTLILTQNSSVRKQKS